MLINAGADPKYRGCGEIALNSLAAAPGAYQARPSIPIAETLLAHGAPLSNAAEAVPPSNRNDPLVTAAIFGDADLVRWLHAHGAPINYDSPKALGAIIALLK